MLDAFGNLVFKTLLLFVLFYATFYCHEGGHYMMARKMGFTDVRMNFKGSVLKYPVGVAYRMIADDPSRHRKRIKVIMSGVLMGLIPFVPVFYLEDLTIWMIMLIGYVFGCISDAKHIVEELRETD
jgi:hypothetical protein